MHLKLRDVRVVLSGIASHLITVLYWALLASACFWPFQQLLASSFTTGLQIPGHHLKRVVLSGIESLAGAAEWHRAPLPA